VKGSHLNRDIEWKKIMGHISQTDRLNSQMVSLFYQEVVGSATEKW
jgi:hypothetical protein